MSRSLAALVPGALALALASTSCGGSDGSVGAAGATLAGSWAATAKSGTATSTVTWRFAADGTWGYSIVVAQDNVETTLCQPPEAPDTHWEDQGSKVALRSGSTTTDRLYELTESGQRLRLEPPVAAFQTSGSVTVNTYTRIADAPLPCSKTR